MATNSDMAQRRAAALANRDPEYLTRRAELIDAAARVFRTKGYSAAKLQDIAAAVGLDRATIYYYVSGKEELFQVVVAEAVRQNVHTVEKLRADKRPADQKLRALIEALMLAYERHYPYLYVYVQENMGHMTGTGPWQREMLALGRRFDRAIRAIVEDGIEQKTIMAQSDDARVIANAIVGMCNWTHRWFHPKAEGDARSVAEVFSNLILDGLRPKSR